MHCTHNSYCTASCQSQLAMAISSAGSFIRQCIVEVERKFKPTADSISRLRQNAGAPHYPSDRTFQALSFQTLVGPVNQNFEDTYYDADHILSTQGIWVRCRGGDWQAKIRHGGNFINSSFQELSGREAVATMIQKYFPKAQLHASGASGISEMRVSQHIGKPGGQTINSISLLTRLTLGMWSAKWN